MYQTKDSLKSELKRLNQEAGIWMLVIALFTFYPSVAVALMAAEKWKTLHGDSLVTTLFLIIVFFVLGVVLMITMIIDWRDRNRQFRQQISKL